MPDQPYLLDLIQKDPEAFFGMVIYKELNWETLMKTLKDSVKEYAGDHHYPCVLRRFRLRRCV